MSDPDNDGHLRLTPCLLRAIEEHKYLKSCECCREVGLREAAEDFLRSHAERWRSAKQREDNARQIQEIQKHLWIESEKAGRDVGRSEAGAEWVYRHARTWRLERESLGGNDFVVLEVAPSQDAEGQRAALLSALERIGSYSCDVFAGQRDLADPDFLLRPEPEAAELSFVHLRPGWTEGVRRLEPAPGKPILLAAYGRDAREALAAIQSELGARVAAI